MHPLHRWLMTGWRAAVIFRALSIAPVIIALVRFVAYLLGIAAAIKVLLFL